MLWGLLPNVSKKMHLITMTSFGGRGLPTAQGAAWVLTRGVLFSRTDAGSLHRASACVRAQRLSGGSQEAESIPKACPSLAVLLVVAGPDAGASPRHEEEPKPTGRGFSRRQRQGEDPRSWHHPYPRARVQGQGTPRALQRGRGGRREGGAPGFNPSDFGPRLTLSV